MSAMMLLFLPVLPSLSLAIIWHLPISILIIVIIPVEPFGFGLVPALVEYAVLVAVVALEELFGEVLLVLVLVVGDEIVLFFGFIPWVFAVAFILPFPFILILLIFSLIPSLLLRT